MSDHFTGDDLEAYRRGEADAEAFMAQERAYHDNPLRKMQGRARQLNEESDNQDVAALADLVDDLLLHMLNKEEGLI